MNASRLRRVLAGCSLAAALCLNSGPAWAQAACDAVDSNLVANCGFEAGDPPTGWTGFGTMTSDAVMPHSGAASLRVASQIFGNDKPTVFAKSNCFDLMPGHAYAFGGWARVLATTTTVQCVAFVIGSQLPDCSGPRTIVGSAGQPAFSGPAEWRPFTGTTSPPSSLSGYVELFCDGGDPGDTFTAGFDDAFFAIEAVDLFASGFE